MGDMVYIVLLSKMISFSYWSLLASVSMEARSSLRSKMVIESQKRTRSNFSMPCRRISFCALNFWNAMAKIFLEIQH
ncbi:MAG: hypothetical protein ACTS73_02670 [Arsenophonus sp. NEOnobi-MAG3]